MFIRTESFKDFIRFYPVVSTIIAIQVVIWLMMYLDLPFGGYIYYWGRGFNLMIDQGEYWRHVTPIFIHSPAGIMHVLFNSFSLVLFGPALEQMLGKIKFLLVYFISGIIGNLFTYYLEPDPYYIHVGASGAIYGLFGLYIYMVFLRKDLIDQANAKLVSTITIIGLVMTFLSTDINIYAHLFGFIGGLALGPLALINVRPFSLSRNRRKPRNDGSVQFDPNRWNKKRYRYKHIIRPVIIGAIAILVILGLVAQLF
ncbi:rhomboid family intramembrane serine protease [Aquibacillus koreensis]|uniref:Rhomboid family intramembrane serine protease n=1 Tax=Aquibacillus koreensis TaxID=279446 RepID=A0A9X3WM09_9BACI|nr:rhomboid family intramembrane serine protease [Aquibacillus koreensis]MCT2534956.1 rhomboid family intramembrane serine protease [Aquibacillus koreensis]MDC3422150.1 rhomboid family intramembrane serine protease [Aquibacillus koreensis]